MAIAEMSKVGIIGLLSDKERVLRSLQDLGVVQIRDLSTAVESEEWSGTAQRNSDLQQLLASEDMLGRIRSALEFIERIVPRKKSIIEQFAGFQVGISRDEFRTYESDTEAIERVVSLAEELASRYARATQERSDLSAQLAEMAHWRSLDASVEQLTGTRLTRVLVGIVEAESFRAFCESIEEAADGAVVVVQVSSEDTIHRVVVIAHRDVEQDVLSALRSFGFSQTVFPFGTGTVSQFISEGEQRLVSIDLEIEHISNTVKSDLALEKMRLYAAYDAASAARDRYQAGEKLARTGQAFALEGWVRTRDVEMLTSSLLSISDSLVVQVSEPGPSDTPPVSLENKGGFRPFEVILDLYSMPNRFEIDPTAFVAVFFALFFAMAMADIGYGIALALICIVLLRKVHMSGLGEKTFKLFFITGMVSIAVGLITGSLFGVTLKFGLINPVEQPLTFLVISFGIGLIQVYVGMAIRFYENVHSGKLISGIFDQGFWALLIASLILLGVGSRIPGPVRVDQIGKYGAVIAVVGLVLTQGRHQKNPVLKLGSGLASLYNISGYLSDVLSYSRLLGLGMASGVIASVINLVAGMFWPVRVVGPVIAIVILIGGHAFNLFIGVIGAYVHSSRLQYIEFFGKFFEGGGKAFSPFTTRNRFTYLLEAQGQGGNQTW